MSEKRRGWTQDEIKFIKDNYGVLSLHDLSSKLSRSYSSISSRIYKLGLDDPRCWTEEEDRILIENYEYNPIVWDLLSSRSREAITQRAQKYRLSRQCGNYQVNWKFFDTYTEEMAYVLGFFIANGCLEPKLKRLSFSQCLEDVDVLYKIRSAMNCYNPLCFKKTRNEVSLYIHNQYLVDKLVAMGFNNKKSISAIIPIQIDNQYMKHIIRGILDGAGSLYFENNRVHCQFLGTYNVLDTIRKYFVLHSISNKQISKRKVNVHVLNYSKKKEVFDILNLLYKESTIAMDRKHKKAMEILDYLQGAFARGVIPRKNNLTQNEETLPSNVEGNLVGKTCYARLACRGQMSGSYSYL